MLKQPGTLKKYGCPGPLEILDSWSLRGAWAPELLLKVRQVVPTHRLIIVTISYRPLLIHPHPAHPAGLSLHFLLHLMVTETHHYQAQSYRWEHSPTKMHQGCAPRELTP